jgi:hypothetical protein
LSPSIILAYLIKDRGMTLKSALGHLVNERNYQGIILPKSVMYQLELFQKKIREVYGLQKLGRDADDKRLHNVTVNIDQQMK